MKSGLTRLCAGVRSSILMSTLALVCLGFTASGCQKNGPPPTPEQQYLMHTIAFQGETFTIISAWYTGSGQNWKELVAANPDVRPNRLRPGTMIKIPRVLLTRDAVLPKSFVDAATAKLRTLPPERGTDEGVTPVAVNPATDTPKATPPVFDEPPAVTVPDTQPEGPTTLPTLPDPTIQNSSAAAVPVIEASSSSAPVVAQPEKVVVQEKPVTAASSAGAPTKDEDHQKTRDQLLKELLQDY